jgi:hypothetical protein
LGSGRGGGGWQRAGVVVGVVMGRSGDARDEQRGEGVVLGKAARRRSQSGVNLEAGCGRRPFIPRFLGDESCRRVAERSGDAKWARKMGCQKVV